MNEFLNINFYPISTEKLKNIYYVWNNGQTVLFTLLKFASGNSLK